MNRIVRECRTAGVVFSLLTAAIGVCMAQTAPAVMPSPTKMTPTVMPLPATKHDAPKSGISIKTDDKIDKSGPNSRNAKSTPQLKIEYFGTERGFTVARGDVVLLCVARNVGDAPLPEKTIRLRCFQIAGLDYTSGDLTPEVPALAPNQAVAFRWRFTATDPQIAPIAAVTAISDGSTSTPLADNVFASSPLTLTVVPRLDAPLHSPADISGVDKKPQAGATDDEAWLASNRVALRIQVSNHDDPVISLAGREGSGWHTVGVVLPLARIYSGEDGQRPWWETVHWQHASAYSDKNRAIITMVGEVGGRWRANVELEVRRDTAVIIGHLSLKPLQAIRCYGVELPRLLATGAGGNQTPTHADGVPALLPALPASPLPARARIAAAHQGAITFGLSWGANPPFPGWSWQPLSGGDNVTTTVMGVGCAGEERGVVMTPGMAMVFPFRLFATGPSDTVRDALKFGLP